MVHKLESINTKNLLKWLYWILIFAVSIMFVVLSFYFINFHGELSPSHEQWGAFGDYFGGTINPVLSFLTLIALLLTIILQNKQLEISSNELEATRQELKRSAEAHEKSELSLQLQAKALEISARISAISHLLGQAEDTIRSITSYQSGSSQEAQRNTVAKNKMELTLELRKLYEQLKSFDNEKP